MKHVLVSEELHKALRLKAIHSSKPIQEIANKILSAALKPKKQKA